MKVAKGFRVFTSDQMTNDEYHSRELWVKDYISGSGLSDVYSTCPAAWRYAVREPSKALEFGTQSHTVMLEVDRFNSTYRRAPMVSEIKDAITSQTALASKLKSCGLIGTSGKQYPELVKMMSDNELDLNVMWLIDMIEQSKAFADGVELVDAEAYDKCIAMRATLLRFPEHARCLNSDSAYREFSIFGEVHGVKCKARLDHVDKLFDVVIDGVHYDEVVVITDYKTTQSVKPSEFARHAFNFGYYLKMWLQRELFRLAFNETCPVICRLLAQEKKEPFLPMAFIMTNEQLAIGQHQAVKVLYQLASCIKSDVWSSYENNASETRLPTPSFVEYEFKDLFVGQ